MQSYLLSKQEMELSHGKCLLPVCITLKVVSIMLSAELLTTKILLPRYNLLIY